MLKLLLPPIPPLNEPPNWARLPIAECGEPLVPCEGERILVRPQYALDGIPGAPESVLVRSGVRDRLQKAALSLPAEISLLVFDGFRPLQVQRYLYENYAAQIAREYPHKNEAERNHLVNQFVASPNPSAGSPPPHRTGGAVDVYLVESTTLTPLPMGTDADAVVPASITHYFEQNLQEPFTTNRRLLYHAMTEAGFTNYLGEWWHYDFGNQRWANCSGNDKAIYGIPAEDQGGN